MERISAVEYTAPDGATLTLTKDAGGCHLEHSETGEVVNTRRMGEMLGHIHGTYGWPLPCKSVD